jgi:lysyl-tRNA synthetase class I
MVHEILSRKNPSQKRAGGVAQVVEHLPNKNETLSSNSTTAKKKKKAYVHKQASPKSIEDCALYDSTYRKFLGKVVGQRLPGLG